MKYSKAELRSRLVRTMADGQFHSGQALAEELSVSRAAVSNHLKYLGSLGLDIFSVHGKGNKLATPLDLLDRNVIIASLVSHHVGDIEILDVIDSTNAHLLSSLQSANQGNVVMAEAQTAGRGRHGRVWSSPFAANLYLSKYWAFKGGHQAISGLSLVIGVAIAQALENFLSIETNVKWPNDIYCEEKKLGGVLIEVEGQLGGTCHCVIGVGLNVNMPADTHIDQPWTDLNTQSIKPFTRNALASHVISAMQSALIRFERDGLAAFIDDWEKLNIYRDKPVALHHGNQVLSGICKGIDAQGGIRLLMDGKTQSFYGGEISVRPAILASKP